MDAATIGFFSLSALIFVSFLTLEITLLKRVPLSYYETSSKTVLCLYNVLFFAKMLNLFLVLVGAFNTYNCT